MATKFLLLPDYGPKTSVTNQKDVFSLIKFKFFTDISAFGGQMSENRLVLPSFILDLDQLAQNTQYTTIKRS